jgi:hypothetical protein
MGHDLDDEELMETRKRLKNLYHSYDYKQIMKEAEKIIKQENKLKYNFIKRYVKIGKKEIHLGKLENRFMACMWFSFNGKASYKLINRVVYGYKKIDYVIIRRMAFVLRKKGIPIIAIRNFGYKLKSI